MWLVLFFVFIAASVVHALYFSGVVLRAAIELWPSLARRRRIVRAAYLVVACSIPIILLVYSAYALLARPESLALPHGTWVDVTVVYPFWFVTLWSFQCTIVLLPTGLALWLLRRGGVARGPRWRRGQSIAVLALVGVAFGFVLVRIVQEHSSLVVRHYDVALRDLPPDLDGFRIALIADPQADEHTGDARLAQVVGAVRAQHPDLTLIAGDIITRPPEYIGVAARHLGQLKSPEGVYACIGDHDNFAYFDRERSRREVREGLARVGVPMLDDEVVSIRRGSARLDVIVATNNYVNRLSRESARKLIDRARGADVTVLLAHQASTGLLDAAARGGVDLFLSGHTHGGQIDFWTPLGDLAFARLETSHISGRYDVHGMPLIVSSGVGTSIAPFRYRAPATVEIVTLRAAPATRSSAPGSRR